MKRFVAILLAVMLVVGLTACAAQEAASTWEDQYELGIRYLSEGNYEEAIIAFTAAIEIDPMRVEAYVARGDAYFQSGQPEKLNPTIARRWNWTMMMTIPPANWWTR